MLLYMLKIPFYTMYGGIPKHTGVFPVYLKKKICNTFYCDGIPQERFDRQRMPLLTLFPMTENESSFDLKMRKSWKFANGLIPEIGV